MADMMSFPNTWEEFEELYGFSDSKQIYTNGSRLISSFRVKQWLDHIKAKQQTDIEATATANHFYGREGQEQTDCPWK